MFTDAKREQLKLRMAITGPEGSGKSFTSMSLMYYLLGGQEFFLIDSERGRAKIYAPTKGKANPEKGTFAFKLAELDGKYDTLNYIKAIDAAAAAGAKGLVIDGISQAWEGRGGLLDQKNQLDKAGGNSYTNWAGITRKQNDFINAMLDFPGHLIVTMRSHVDHVVENVNGKNVIRKIGLQPVQREGVPYEFDIMALMENATLSFTKLRQLEELRGQTFDKPGKDLAMKISEWLGLGIQPPLTVTEFRTAMAAKGYDDDAKIKAFTELHPEVTGPYRFDELLKLA